MWGAGEVVRDPQVRFLPTDLAPGDYRLTVAGDSAEAIINASLVVR